MVQRRAGGGPSLIGQMGNTGQGEARQGKAGRGEVRHNKAQGNCDRCVGNKLQPARLVRIMTGRLVRPASNSSG